MTDKKHTDDDPCSIKSIFNSLTIGNKWNKMVRQEMNASREVTLRARQQEGEYDFIQT